jgi:putative phage-type endonuclease
VNNDYDAWKMSRLGKATASRIADVVAQTKSGWSAYRRKYMIELMAERLTGMPAKQFLNEAMMWGTQTEPAARRAYEQHTGKSVKQVWFIDHPTIPMSGASPDGMVGDDGLLEIKCSETATHLTLLLDKKINPDYIIQMQWQMAATQRAWCDFASYDPRVPPQLRLYVVRVLRDDAKIAELEKLVKEFLAELDAAIKSLGPFELVKPSMQPAPSLDGSEQVAPMNMERQIRPEDEANWKVTPLLGKAAT